MCAADDARHRLPRAGASRLARKLPVALGRWKAMSRVAMLAVTKLQSDGGLTDGAYHVASEPIRGLRRRRPAGEIRARGTLHPDGTSKPSRVSWKASRREPVRSMLRPRPLARHLESPAA